MVFLKKLGFALLLTTLTSSCASRKTVKAMKSASIVICTYQIGVGGTQEAGLTRSFFVKTSSLPAEVEAKALIVDGLTLPIKAGELNNTLTAVERFDPKGKRPEKPNMVSVVLAFEGEEVLISTQNITEKETIYYPSAPPSD